MAKLIVRSKNPNSPNKLTIKENIHIARAKKYRKIMLSSIVLNILLLAGLILTTIK